jgi:hypothetical protein
MCTNYDTHPRVLRWLTPEIVKDTIEKTGSMVKAAEFLGVHRETIRNRLHNHKIASIEPMGYEDVYDIEVDEYHNFALSSGVFVHNSADMLQLLRRLGFDTSEISVDKTPLPYMKLRSMVYEDLIFMPMSKLLRTELEELEVTPDGAKIDHPMKGSKDMADGVCGSVISTIRNSDKHKMMYITMSKPHSISSEVKQLFWPEMQEGEV